MDERLASDQWIGDGPSSRRLRRELARAASAGSTLLLTGETGCGKGLAARLVHNLSERRQQPFVHLDCAALAPGVIESEIFGHERGAFTGAVTRRVGRFELASGGTLFLDEIGELEPRLQSKLLRLLEDRAFERLGGTRTLAVRARVVAATSRDLHRAVQEGRFRADLYFRLAVLHLELPPLRERLEDLPQLVRAGLARACRRLEMDVPPASEVLLSRLRGHAWPGNVRELMNLLERLVVHDRLDALDAGGLESWLEAQLALPAMGPARAWPRPRTSPAPSAESDAARHPGSARSERIVEALLAAGGNVSRAARRLGLARSTLRYRIARLGLEHLIPRD